MLRNLCILATVTLMACHAEVINSPPLTHAVAGTYDGTLESWQVSWTLQQDSTQVTGTGTFTRPNGTTAPFTVRGTMRYDVLNVRLVGAPGDTNADSVSYSGTFNPDLYGGIVFDGPLTGPAPSLVGELTMYLRGTP